MKENQKNLKFLKLKVYFNSIQLLHATNIRFLCLENGKRFTWPKVVVKFIIWAKTSCVLILRDACFRMRIALGVVLIRSLVSAKRDAGRLRNGSGVALY